jgi:Mor family transcriptional regulator
MSQVLKDISEILSGHVDEPEKIAYIICREYSGQLIYFNVIKQTTNIKQQLKERFTGNNQRALAKDFGISLNQVYKLLREQKNETI